MRTATSIHRNDADSPEDKGERHLSRDQFVSRIVQAFPLRYPGVAVVVLRIGERGPTAGIWRHYFDAAGLRLTCETHICVEASLVNAVSVVSGKISGDAVRVAVEDARKWWNRLLKLGNIFENGDGGLVRTRVRKVPLAMLLINSTAA